MNKIICFVFLVCLLCVSCIEERVELSQSGLQGAVLPCDLVVDGFVGTERTTYPVRLTRPVAWSDAGRVEVVSEAEVYVVLDGARRFSFVFNGEEGCFLSVDSISVAPGTACTLVVECDGKTYTATDTVPAFPVADVLFPFDPEVDNQGADFVQGGYLVHNFGYDTPLITLPDISRGALPDLKNRNTMSNRIYMHRGSIPQGMFPGQIRLSMVSGRHDERLEFINMGISDHYYRYLVSRFNETDWKSSIFGTIPGNTQTNLSEGATGFFYAVSTARFSMTYGELRENYIDEDVSK